MPYLSKRRAPSQLTRANVSQTYKKPRTQTTISKWQPQTYIRKTSNTTEVKAINAVVAAAVSPGASGTALVFGRVDLGSGDDQRNGKAIKHISFETRWRFERFANVEFHNYRIIVGVWKQANGGATVNTADILENPGDITSPIRSESSQNLIVLDDFYVNMPAQSNHGSTGIADGELRFMAKKYKRAFIQEYNGSLSSNVTNWTHFVALFTNNVAGGTVRLNTQNYYTDS